MKKLLPLLVVPLLGLAACGGSGSVSKSDLEAQVKSQLEASTGQMADSVTCPGDLQATVGTTQQCELKAGELVIPVMVTVTEVADGKVKFDIVAADAPSE